MRTRNRININAMSGDPGKDLFAYLFLLVMMFSFMLLMSMNSSESRQKAPDQNGNGKSSFSRVPEKNVAVLEKKNGALYLRFGRILYNPSTDMEKLEQDKRITIKKNGDKVQKFLYIKKDKNQTISLFDYLDTFKFFSDNQISVAFVRVIQ